MKKTVLFLIVSSLLLTLAACGVAEAEPTAEVTETTENTVETTLSAEADAQSLCSEGTQTLEAGDLAAAREAFAAALALDERLVECWLGLSEIAVREYDFEGAEAILTEALEKTGNDPAIAEKLEMLRGESVTDSMGRLLRMNGFDDSGTLLGYILYTYRPDGKVEAVTSFDPAGVQTGHVLMAYDDQGRVTVGYGMIGDERTVGRIEYIRDEAGNEIRRDNYSPEGALEMSFISEYDSQGQKVRQEIHIGGAMVSYTLYSYAPNGLLEREDRYDGSGRLDTYLTYTYDEAGWEIGYRWYYADGSLYQQRVYTRDGDGNILKEEYFDGAGDLTHVYEYE